MTERARVLLLIAVSVLVYANTLANGLVFDDKLYITDNPQVTQPSLQALFSTNRDSSVFRPIYFATLALNWKFAGPRPFGYHLLNLFLHVAVVLLLYVTLRKLLDSVSQGSTIAFASALLFAVHPIHTEAVAWASARSELLAAGFLLLAWLLHLHDRPILSLVCFALAVLSKESAVAFVPLVIIGDYACGQLKRLWTYVAPTVAAVAYVVVLLAVHGGVQRGYNFADNPMAALPPLWRILNAFPIAWKYVALLIYPATLSCDYSYNAIPLYVSPWRMLPALLAAVLVFAAWLWALYKRKIPWTLAGAIYFAGFATTANILVATGSVMGERLAYFPSAGFCLLLALLWVRLETRRREFAWSLLILIVVALGARAVVRNFDWHSNLTLFSAAVHAVPGSSKMHGNLGAVYAAMGQFELARSEMQTALRIYPNLPGTVASYGVLESQLGNAQEALRYLRKAVSLTDRTDIEYDFRVVTLAAQLMKLGENDEALRILNDEVAASPTYARAWSNRAVIRYQRGELESARADAETALRLDPSNAQAQHLLSALNSNAAVPPHT